MIRKLLCLTRPLLPALFGSFLCSLGAVFAQLLVIYILLNIFIQQTTNWSLMIFTCLVALFIGLASFLEQYLGHLVAFHLLSDLRNQVYRKLRQLAPAKLDDKESGKILKLMNTDIELIEVFFAHIIVPVALAFVYGITLVIIYSLNFGWVGVYVLFCYLIIGVILPFYRKKKLTRFSSEAMQNKGMIQQTMLEFIQGKTVLFQLNAFLYAFDRLNKQFQKEYQTNKKIDQLKLNQHFLSEYTLIVFLFFLFLLIYTGIQSQSGMIVWVLLFPFTFSPFLALSNLSASLSKSMNAANNLFAFFAEEPLVSEEIDGPIDEIQSIEVKKLSFRYPLNHELALSQTSLSIPNKKIIGITGESGIGKSTFVKLLMKWYNYDSGLFQVNNRELRILSTNAVRSQINYLPQNPQIFEGTIRENLILRKKVEESMLLDFLDKVSLIDKINQLERGLDTRISAKKPILSSGELQKMEVVRALLHPSSVLILDEPTSNLDAFNERIILEVIQEHYKGMVILITHRQKSLAYCDEIYRLENKKFYLI